MAERKHVPVTVETHGDTTHRPATVDHRERDDTPLGPLTPGARRSPQHPGEVPDRSTIPGQFGTRVPPRVEVRRPLTEYGSAQRIAGVYAATPGAENDPARFEQATATYEELRKAEPAQLPPERPGPDYYLREGDQMASEMRALEGNTPTGVGKPSAPTQGAPAGEAWSARPGGGTAEQGTPARADAPAAEIGSGYTPGDAPTSVRAPSDAVAGSGGATTGPVSPAVGEDSSLAGTLPAAKDGETEVQAGPGPKGNPPTPAQQ